MFNVLSPTRSGRVVMAHLATPTPTSRLDRGLHPRRHIFLILTGLLRHPQIRGRHARLGRRCPARTTHLDRGRWSGRRGCGGRSLRLCLGLRSSGGNEGVMQRVLVRSWGRNRRGTRGGWTLCGSGGLDLRLTVVRDGQRGDGGFEGRI